MYDTHDNTGRFPNRVPFDREPELPEPLDHWTLRDFDDIVPVAHFAS